MRTLNRAASQGLFRGRERSRVLTLLCMLAVLVLLIMRVAEPATWHWLTGDVAASPQQDNPDQASAASRVSETPPTAEEASVTPGPTDLDEDQQAAAQEEFQAVTDSTLGLAREEMTVYWRLFSWAEHQSLAEMNKRAERKVVLNDFMLSPDEQRGKLVAIDLNVRQIFAYDAPVNSAGIEKVYEVRGYTDESGAWWYMGVTAHLPPGMPTGQKIRERATFVGYFIKLQGYHEAGAKPNAKPLAAPLLVGRMAWKPQAKPAPAPASDSSWILWVLGALAAFWVARIVLPLVWPKSTNRPAIVNLKKSAESGELSVEDWLSRAQQGSLPDCQESGGANNTTK